MSLDAEQPHFGAASRARDARRFDRFCSNYSHICKGNYYLKLVNLYFYTIRNYSSA